MTPEEREALLNTPAFGKGSEEIKEEPKEVTESEEEVKEEEAPAQSEEESKVPYSRFKKFHDEATQLREELAELRRKVEYKSEVPQPEEEIPDTWLQLYGDSDISREAWKIQKKQNEEIFERARNEAIEAVRSQQKQEADRVKTNMEILENEFETLSDFVGREVTAKEQEALLDIVDYYTPKDKEGNYAGSILSLEKAWEIYELKQGAIKAPKKTARDNIALMLGSQNQGDPNLQAERDKNFNPLDWNAWKGRL